MLNIEEELLESIPKSFHATISPDQEIKGIYKIHLTKGKFSETTSCWPSHKCPSMGVEGTKERIKNICKEINRKIKIAKQFKSIKININKKPKNIPWRTHHNDGSNGKLDIFLGVPYVDKVLEAVIENKGCSSSYHLDISSLKEIILRLSILLDYMENNSFENYENDFKKMYELYVKEENKREAS